MSSESLSQQYLADALSTFRSYKKLAEKALNQLNEEEFFVTLDQESNSVAVIMKHIAGNYAYHIGQIVFLAKHFRSADWKSLSIPRNRSAEFNRKV